MNQFPKFLLFCISLVLSTASAQVTNTVNKDVAVSITQGLPYVDVQHMGQTVRIARNQDQNNIIPKIFGKTSRPCPPFCIQPIKISPEIKSYGELELLNFLNTEAASGTGLLLDVRMPRFFDAETIPGSINIPFLLIISNTQDILPLLGAKKVATGWDFKQASTVLIFCNGPWCAQSSRAINALLGANYPTDKIGYYRGGMQLWKLFGLNTVGSDIQ
ncbi:MAG: rhodanese-like domain-containing protein [Arenicellales bacterium]